MVWFGDRGGVGRGILVLGVALRSEVREYFSFFGWLFVGVRFWFS